MKYLVGSGARLEEPNHDGFTPLAQAVFHGRLEVVKYLLRVGANPLAKGNDGRSVLDLAKHPDPPSHPHQKEILRFIRSALLDQAAKRTRKQSSPEGAKAIGGTAR